jgi:hypothetical protein
VSDEVLERALRRFDEAANPQLEMRALSLAARRFATIPGAQWEDDGWAEQFEKSIRIEGRKIQRPIRKIETDYRENRIIPDFRPDGKEADQETADALDGLHRADSYEFKAQQARDNAFSEAVMGGFGAYRLASVDEDEYDPDNDHRRVNPGLIIADADQKVFFDPQAVLYDKSDARFAFVLTAYTRDGFKDEWGEDKVVSWPEGVTKRQFDWYATELVYVAEYYEKEDKHEVCYVLDHQQTGKKEKFWASDIEGDVKEWVDAKKLAGFNVVEKRKKRCRIHKYILSGAEMLEDKGRIAGQCIPIVPVYGNRAFVDGMERFWGIVQPNMDLVRVYNSCISRLAEVNATSPNEKPIFTPEMVAGHEDSWSRQHIDRLAYGLINPLTDPNTGQIVAYIKPADMSPVLAALLQIVSSDLLEDEQDGADTVKANTSAEAMDIAAMRVDAKSGVYLDNMRQSVQREGEIYLGIVSEEYTEEGREMNTMSEDGDDGQIILMENTSEGGENRIRHDLTRGKYKVIASVSEATATRRDKTVRSSLHIAEVSLNAGDNEMSQAAVITAVANSDGEGIDDLKKFARKRGLQIGLFEPNEEEQAAMAEQSAEPDPTTILVQAQAADLTASAEKKTAETAKAKAQTLQIMDELSTPKVIRMGNQAR